MHRTRISASAREVSCLPPLLATIVFVMIPDSSDTSQNRSLLFDVLIVLLRTVCHWAAFAVLIRCTSDTAQVALAEAATGTGAALAVELLRIGLAMASSAVERPTTAIMLALFKVICFEMGCAGRLGSGETGSDPSVAISTPLWVSLSGICVVCVEGTGRRLEGRSRGRDQFLDRGYPQPPLPAERLIDGIMRHRSRLPWWGPMHR